MLTKKIVERTIITVNDVNIFDKRKMPVMLYSIDKTIALHRGVTKER